MDDAVDHCDDTRDAVTDADALILVDEADREVGQLSKAQCHEGRGILHRAFSLLIFNAAGELLLSSARPPSACGRCTGRTAVAAIRAAARAWKRRLSGACTKSWACAARCEFLFKFQYQAQLDATGAENELCSVFIGTSAEPVEGEPRRNRRPGAGWARSRCRPKWSQGAPGRFTPGSSWNGTRIWRDHRPAVLARVHNGVLPKQASVAARFRSPHGHIAIADVRVASYLAGRKLRGVKRYPLVLMLEPLFHVQSGLLGLRQDRLPEGDPAEARERRGCAAGGR